MSTAQYEGCLDHVAVEEIEERSTPAAEYARGDRECDEHAGPLCGEYTGNAPAGY